MVSWNYTGLYQLNEKTAAMEAAMSTGKAPDYVFAPGYPLMPLEEVEAYVRANEHLPKMPSGEAIEGGEVGLGRLSMKLLEKVEELTLYAIEQEKELERQAQRIEGLEARLDALERLARNLARKEAAASEPVFE